MTAPLHVAVLGAGSAGRRHIGNLLALGARVSAWRARGDLAADLAAEFGIEAFDSPESAIAAADAVVVATASDGHLAPALAALRAGKPLYLEKPVTHTAEGLDDLTAAAAGQGVVEVGCQLRAHPALGELRARLASGDDGPVHTYRAAVGQHIAAWRPGTDWRAAYTADGARGGGALFELIHEIDLAQWLVAPARSVVAELTPFPATVAPDAETPADAVANLVLTDANGVSGQVQMDMLTPGFRREFEIVAANAVYRCDLAAGTLNRSDARGSEIVFRVPDGFARNDLFVAHMRHFLRRASGEDLRPACPLADGIHAVRTAVAARAAAATGRRVPIGGAP